MYKVKQSTERYRPHLLSLAFYCPSSSFDIFGGVYDAALKLEQESLPNTVNLGLEIKKCLGEEAEDMELNPMDEYEYGTSESDSDKEMSSVSSEYSSTLRMTALLNKGPSKTISQRIGGILKIWICAFFPIRKEIEYQLYFVKANIKWNVLALILLLSFYVCFLTFFLSTFSFWYLGSLSMISFYVSFLLIAFCLVIEIVNIFCKNLQKWWISLIVSVLVYLSFFPCVQFYRFYSENGIDYESYGALVLIHVMSTSYLYFGHVYFRLISSGCYCIYAAYSNYYFTTESISKTFSSVVVAFMAVFFSSIGNEVICRTYFHRKKEIEKNIKFSSKEKKRFLRVTKKVLSSDVIERIKTEEIIYDDVGSAFCGFIQVNLKSERENKILEQFKMFNKFERIFSRVGAKKIKTMNNVYYFILINEEKTKEENFPLILRSIQNCFSYIKIKGNYTLKIGISEGSIATGIVGYKKLLFDSVGNAVNVSARLCYSCEHDNHIHFDYENLKNSLDKYKIVGRGEKLLKGKGNVETVYIDINDLSF